MPEENIAEYLIKEQGFRKFYGSLREVDYDRYSCLIRLHDFHYLLWSEEMKHFTLRQKHPYPKGKPGRGEAMEYHIDIMIPKTINNIEEALQLLSGIIDYRFLKLYN